MFYIFFLKVERNGGIQTKMPIRKKRRTKKKKKEKEKHWNINLNKDHHF